MKYQYLLHGWLLVIGLSLVVPSIAQPLVTNVRIQTVDEKKLEIRYDLINKRRTDSIYFEVRSRVKGLLQPRSEYITGDIGQSSSGENRLIVWNALANGYRLDEEIQVTVRIHIPPPATSTATNDRKADVTATVSSLAKSNLDTVKQKRRTGGPEFALLSLIAPGIGNIFVQTPRPRIRLRPLITVACYGLMVYGFQQRTASKTEYASYLEQRNETEAQPFYNRANDLYHRYLIATRLAGAIWTADVIATFVRGLRNQKARSSRKVSAYPGVEFGQPVAILRYSF